LAGIQEVEKKLIELGYQIIAISTDSPQNLAKTLNKQQLTYTLLSDDDLVASKLFGIAYVGPKAYDKILKEGSNGKNVDKLLPVPSVFILNTKGVIQFEYINPDFKQRISAGLLQAVAEAVVKEMK
jgi:peroxiredoxin